VGGLAHFIEEEGIPTTQISLIRRHTEIIKPPRALWVTFEMGRPVGVPNHPEFQKRVIRAALELLEASDGPVLEDFPEEATVSDETETVLACPVDFTQDKEDVKGVEKWCAILKREMASMRPWYEMAIKQRGRTTVGTSGLGLDALADFICSFLEGDFPEPPRDDISLPYILNLATDDLKAYYYEGITSQPGQSSPSSEAVSNWFWGETVAGRILLAVKETCKKSEDGMMQIVGKMLIVPVNQSRRKKRG